MRAPIKIPLCWANIWREYLDEFEAGRFDERSQFQYILPIRDAYIEAQRGDLIVGGAGCDGVEFCLRVDHGSIWAYYPIESRYQQLAENLSDFWRGWMQGTIVV